jgi:mycothiol synthase
LPVPHIDVRRTLGADDLAEVDALLSDVERADGLRPLSDHMWIDLREGGREGFAGLLAREPGHGHLVAYSQLSRGNESWLVDVVVHPHHRYDMAALGPDLMDVALGVVSEEGGGRVHWWVFEPTPVHETIARGAGLRPGRTAQQMRTALPLVDPPPSIDTASFRPGNDEEEWLRVNNDAFADHPEQGDWTRDLLETRLAQPWFAPEHLLMHWHDGQLAGFCWTKLHRDTNPVLGEIYIVAVDPAHAGRGLGRSLTAAGLAHLHREGAPVGMLYVDASNARAQSMYRSLGFAPHHLQQAFVGDVRQR